jgi:hypothetical protein
MTEARLSPGVDIGYWLTMDQPTYDELNHCVVDVYGVTLEGLAMSEPVEAYSSLHNVLETYPDLPVDILAGIPDGVYGGKRDPELGRSAFLHSITKLESYVVSRSFSFIVEPPSLV